MSKSTVTSKGQVTIPKAAREALGLRPGDQVCFLVREDNVVELRPATVDLNDLFGILKHKGRPVSVEAMDAAIVDAVTESVRGPKRR